MFANEESIEQISTVGRRRRRRRCIFYFNAI